MSGSMRSPCSSSSTWAGSLRSDAGVTSRERSAERGTVRLLAARARPASRRGGAPIRERSAAVAGTARQGRPGTRRPRARAGVHTRSQAARKGRTSAGVALHQLYSCAKRRRRKDLACSASRRACVSAGSAAAAASGTAPASSAGVREARA